MRPILLLLAIAPALASVSGCVGCDSGPPVSARGITDAPSSAGVLGGFALDVMVIDASGEDPMPGAGVVVYWSSKDRSEWEGSFVEVAPGRVRVDSGQVDSTPEAKSVERAMTGDDGVAQFKIPRGRVFGIVAAKDAYTEEWIPAMASGNDDDGAAITLPLYPRKVSGALDVVWGPGGASTGTITNSNYLWDPHPLPFADGEEAERAYAERIVELKVEIEWTNGPTAAGDLAIGVGPQDDEPALFDDDSDNIGAGLQSEQAVFTVEKLRDAAALGSPGIRLGAATDSGYFAPAGLAYTLHAEAILDTAKALFARCVGVGGVASGGGGGGFGGGGGGGGGASIPTWGATGVALAALCALPLLRRKR